MRERRALIRQLGAKCETCPESDLDRLEIDHRHGKSWRSRDVASDQRVRRYKREAAAGLLRVLCKSCNSRWRWWTTYVGHIEYHEAKKLARDAGLHLD